MRVPWHDLKVGAKIGSGSQGSVRTIESGDAFGFKGPIVFKRFDPSVELDVAALEHLIGLHERFTEDQRHVIDEHSTWPLALVEEWGHVIGYLMRAVPEQCWQRIRTAAGEERIPREVQHLFVSDEIGVANLGEVASLPERRQLAHQLAAVMAVFESHLLVFGDLSYRNAVYCLRPHPSIVVLDCDGIRQLGAHAPVDQLHSPGWQPPEGGPPTVATDRYKLGLFVLRALTPGHNAQNRDPEAATHVLDRAGRHLLKLALGPDPDRRPAASEWVTYLGATLGEDGPSQLREGTPPDPASPPPVVAKAHEGDDHRPVPHAPSRTGRRSGGRRVSQPAAAPRGAAALKTLRRPRSRRLRPGHVRSATRTIPAGAPPATASPRTRETFRVVLVGIYITAIAVMTVAIAVGFALRER